MRARCLRWSILCVALGVGRDPLSAATISSDLQFEYWTPATAEAARFRLRRSRIKIREDLGKRRSLYAKVKILPERITLSDAYVDAGWGHGFSFRLGRFKRPFSRAALASSFSLHTSDRDIVYDLFGDNDLRLAGGKGSNEYAGRDVGVAVKWRWKGAEARKANLTLAWTNGGSLGEAGGRSPRHLSGRGWMRFAPSLNAGFSVSWTQVPGGSGDGWASGVDAEWKWRGLELWGEWLIGRNRVIDTRMIGSTVEGTLSVAGWSSGMRVSRVDPDIEILYNAEWAYTPFLGRRLWDGAYLIAELTRFDPAENPTESTTGATTEVVVALRVEP